MRARVLLLLALLLPSVAQAARIGGEGGSPPTPSPTASVTPTPTTTATPTATRSPIPTATPDAAHQIARSTAAGVIGYTALADCGDAGEKCVYDTDTGLWTTGTDDDVPEVGDFGALDLTACPGGQYMTDITSGAAVCAQVAFSQLSGQLGDGQIAAGAVDLDSAEVEGQLPWSKVGVTPTPAATATHQASPKPISTAAGNNAGASGVTFPDHVHGMPDSGVTAGSYSVANVTVNAKGLITDIQPGSIDPALAFFVDLDGVDGTGCGTKLSPCRTINGALAKVAARGDNGALTCNDDGSSACMRCSGTSTACNVRRPYAAACTANQTCSPYTCTDDATKGCAFQCSTTTSRQCLFDGDCPWGETCRTTGIAGGSTFTCTGTPKKCWGGANDGNTCTVSSECPFGSCLNTCSGGDRSGLACLDATWCGRNTCDLTNTDSDNPVCTNYATTSACATGLCFGQQKRYTISIGGGTFYECLTATTIPTIGALNFVGDSRTGTTINCSTGAHTLENDVRISFKSIELVGAGPVIQASGTYAIGFDEVSILNGYGSSQPTMKWTGKGQFTSPILSDTWLGSLSYESWPTAVCMADITKQCAVDASASATCLGLGAAGNCSTRSCSNNRSTPCDADATCTAAGSTCLGGTNAGASCTVDSQCPGAACVAPRCDVSVHNIFLSGAGGTGSGDVYLTNGTLVQGGDGAYDATGLDFVFKSGGLGFNMVLDDVTVKYANGGGSSTTGIKTSNPNPGSFTPYVEVGKVSVVPLMGTQADVSVNVGANTQLRAAFGGPFLYDWRTRSVAGSIAYLDSSSTTFGGGMPGIPVLNTASWPDPQNGECAIFGGTGGDWLLRCYENGTMRVKANDPTTTRGDLIFRNSSGVLARLALGSNGQVLGSNGSDPAWTGIASATTFMLLPGGDGGLLSGYGDAGDVTAPVANTMYCARVVPSHSIAATKLALYLKTGGASSQECGAAIYPDTDGGAALATTADLACGTAQSGSVRSATGLSYTLNAGTTYRYCWYASHTGTVLLGGQLATNAASLANQYATKVATAANPATGTGPPSTTGALSAGDYPMAFGLVSVE